MTDIQFIDNVLFRKPFDFSYFIFLYGNDPKFMELSPFLKNAIEKDPKVLENHEALQRAIKFEMDRYEPKK